MAVTFDRVNKIIELSAPATEITVQELYNSICDYQDNQANMDLSRIVSASGKEALGAGVYVGITVKLLDGWRLRFEERLSETICNVNGGNLVAVDELGNDVFPLAYSNYVMATITSSSSATLQEIEAIEYGSFNNGITIDVINGVDSIVFPAGTPQLPCKTLLNVSDIASERGFKTIYIIGDITLTGIPTGILVDYVFVGQGLRASTVTIDDIQCDSCTFENCEIVGNFSDSSKIIVRNCDIGNVTNIKMDAYNCELSGTITLANSTSTNFYSCVDAIPGTGTPTIDVNDCLSLGLWQYSGGVQINNMTLATNVSVNFSSGRLILDSTCTNGSVIVRGVGSLVNNSSGTSVSDDGLLDIPSIVGGIFTESVDSNIELKTVLQVLLSTIAGLASGGGTENLTFRNASNTADRVTMVVDVNGNRSDVTISPD